MIRMAALAKIDGSLAIRNVSQANR